MAGARPLALSLSLILEEGLDADELRAEVEAIAGAARRRPASRSSPATPRSSSAGTRTACTCARRASAGSTRAPRSRRPPCGPGDRILVSGPVGNHGMAIMLARGRVRARVRDRLGHPLALAGGRRPARRRRAVAAGDARRDARRASPPCSTSWPGPRAWPSSLSEGDVPVDPAVAGAAEILGIDPMYVANEGVLVAFVAPGGRAARRSPPCAAAPGGERAAEIGEVRSGAARDGAGEHGVRRPAGDGPARR